MFIQDKTAFLRNRTNKIKVKLDSVKSGLINTLLRPFSQMIIPLVIRQKKTCLIVFPVALLFLFGSVFIINSHVNNLKDEILDRGRSIIVRFPENQTANWLARARSSRDAWQVESLFKLKAILLSIQENRYLIYALIIDEKSNLIKANTDEKLVGSKYKHFEGANVLHHENGMIAVNYIDTASNEPIVNFISSIYYGKGDKRMKIGSFSFGMSYKKVDSALKRKRILFAFLSFFTLLVAMAVIIMRDRAGSKKPSQVETDMNRIGPYILEKKIAKGGMGVLFLSRKEIGKFRMRVALKVILSDKADDEDYITALLDEANIASQLQHPNIVTLHDFGNIQGKYFIAMEYIDGDNLLAILDKCKEYIPIRYVIYIMSGICKGLDYAHNKVDDFNKKPLNIVHRDISPQNILISNEGNVKIVDFGIARAEQRQSKKTTVGIVKGKLHYMSPEQASSSAEIDRRSDIFSLGLLSYEVLSKEKVYDGDTIQEILKLACQADIKPIKEVRQDLPEELNRIIMKALDPSPSRRYQTAKDLDEDLSEFTKKNDQFKCTKADLSAFMKKMILCDNNPSSEV